MNLDGTAPWVALALLAAVLELVARLRWGRAAGAGAVLASCARTLPGRLVLACFWVFIGVHVFGRYTVPGR